MLIKLFMVWNILDDVTVGKFGEILLMQALPVKRLTNHMYFSV